MRQTVDPKLKNSVKAGCR